LKLHTKLKKVMIINFITCFFLLSTHSINVFAASADENVLNAGRQFIQQYYIEDVPSSKLNAASDMNSLVKSLGDPYSAYFTEEQFNNFTSSINNSFVGIGIQVDAAAEGVKVTSVFDKTPAMNAGIKAGDVITGADGHALKGLSVDEAISYIKGASGSSVHLLITRGTSNLSFDVLREQVTLPTVNASLINNHIGYIEISTFGENTGTEFKNAFEGLKSSADSYIIDLRNNPGGYMDVAFDVAGYFIGSSDALKVQQKDGQAVVYKGIDHNEIIDKPTIFLINGYSASASEILSAAVKDNKKASFIGQTSYGKGVGQNIFQLPDNSYLKLTTFKFVSPLGNQINKVGITPDIKVKEDLSSNIDSLNAAKVLLNNQGTNNNPVTIDKLYSIAYSAAVNAMNLKTQKSINTAREDIAVLYGTDASWSIGEFSKQVDIIQHPFLANIVDAIKKAQQSSSQKDINAARALLDPDLPDVWRNSYSQAIDIVQQSLMQKLVDAHNNAVLTKHNSDLAVMNSLLTEIKQCTNPSITAWADELVSDIASIDFTDSTDGQPAALTARSFTATFEDGKNIPAWSDAMELSNNVTGISSNVQPECSLRSNEYAIGKNTAILYSGYANGGDTTNVVFKVFNVNIPVSKFTVLDYFINPGQENGRYAAVDLHFTDGTTLSSSGALDQKGFSVNAGSGHGGSIPLNAWSQISSNIGKWLDGKVIDKILIAYDHAGSIGEFRGYIDNISISDGSAFSTSFEISEVQPIEFNYAEVNNNITGFTPDAKPVSAISTNEKSHSGQNALKYAGTASGDKENNIVYRLFEEKINVTEDTVLDYFIYPEQENGRFVGIDFLLSDGTTLRDSGAVDQNGASMHPSLGHGGSIPLNSWTEIRSNVGKWLKGKTIDAITLVYDHYGSKGQFSGYLDDIKIINNNNEVSIGPGSPDIKYFGRWDNSSSTAYKSYNGGSYFKVNFTGTTAKLKLAGTSSIYVKIDNGDDVLYKNVSGIVNLTPAALVNGEHSLRVTAYSYKDVINFEGLILDKAAVTRQPSTSNNLIEFIGDSITEGYSNNKEALAAYSWKAGEKLNSEHTQIAYPGICLTDNINFILSHNIGMNTSYFKLQTTQEHPYSPDWAFNRYNPNIIVINLGTNDSEAKVSDSMFESTYESFLANIRAKFPSAEIFVMRTFGNLTFKEGFLSSPTLTAVNARINAGDKKLHFIDTKGWLTDPSDFNDGVHPSESGHNKAAQKLADILKPYLVK